MSNCCCSHMWRRPLLVAIHCIFVRTCDMSKQRNIQWLVNHGWTLVVEIFLYSLTNAKLILLYGLWVSWIKTKVHVFSDILDATVESIPVNGENVEVTQMFTYLGRVIHSSASYELEVNQWLGVRWICSSKVCGTADTCAKGRRSESFILWSCRSCCTPVRLWLGLAS